MDYYRKSIYSAFKRLEGAYAPNTIKSYYADVSHFVDWCDAKGVPAFPLDDCVLADFIEAHQFALKYATVRRKLAALRRSNSLLGCPDAVHSQEFHLALRRMRRGQSARREQLPPPRGAQYLGVTHPTIQSPPRPTSLTMKLFDGIAQLMWRGLFTFQMQLGSVHQKRG